MGRHQRQRNSPAAVRSRPCSSASSSQPRAASRAGGRRARKAQARRLSGGMLSVDCEIIFANSKSPDSSMLPNSAPTTTMAMATRSSSPAHEGLPRPAVEAPAGSGSPPASSAPAAGGRPKAGSKCRAKATATPTKKAGQRMDKVWPRRPKVNRSMRPLLATAATNKKPSSSHAILLPVKVRQSPPLPEEDGTPGLESMDRNTWGTSSAWLSQDIRWRINISKGAPTT
mmetsp:Transcript_92518/g.299109  ORF Transcript_92518/g.299109 Transcript_92518/m.299109 type:complete len:228 (+) Transcript_92518:800-1483(+)